MVRQKGKHRFLSIGGLRYSAIGLLTLFMLTQYAIPAYALTNDDLQQIITKTPYFDPNDTTCSASTSSAGGTGPTLEGHTLPAASGGAGLEEAAHISGGRAVLDRNGAGLALAPAGMTDNDVHFYMNMRWRFRTWAWDGTSRNGPEDSAWYSAAVRKVLISDPATNKSVVASVIESGPAPWTGTKEGQGNVPSYWNGYVDGTPAGYDGRVSGLAPAVFDALGDPKLEWTNGAGTTLNYQWADQSLPAGTTGPAATGSAPTSTTASASVSSGCGNCSITPGQAANGAPTIVIDPGHSGKDNKVTDPQTGLDDHDYPNSPEMQDVFDVSQLVKTKLEADGYKVLLTKQNAMDTVTFRQRATIANQANAALAISIHDQAGKGGYDFHAFSQIYPQQVGEYRQLPDGSHKTVFQLADVAAKSQAYAQIFQKARSQAEGGNTVVKENSFDGRPGIDPGNLSQVQLFATVPWVYNEVGGNNIDKQKYADGLIQGIEQSVPVKGSGSASAGSTPSASTGGGSGACSNGVVAGNIIQTGLNLAWPDSGHGKEKTDATPAYQTAMPQYNGSVGDDEWSDCGVFVATVIISSGADTNYPKRGTGIQQDYVKQHPEKYLIIPNVVDSSQLQPGDILIFNDGSEGHTFIYTGKQAGTNYDAVSASLHGHVPEATYAAGSITYGGRAGKYIIARIKQ